MRSFDFGGVVTKSSGRKSRPLKKSFLELHQPNKKITMPSATVTKSAMNGTKRKSAPVKGEHVKGSKKAKLETEKKPVTKKVSNPLGVMRKKEVVVESSDDDSEESNSDGGVPLGAEQDVGGDDEEDSEGKDVSMGGGWSTS